MLVKTVGHAIFQTARPSGPSIMSRSNLPFFLGSGSDTVSPAMRSLSSINCAAASGILYQAKVERILYRFAGRKSRRTYGRFGKTKKDVGTGNERDPDQRTGKK